MANNTSQNEGLSNNSSNTLELTNNSTQMIPTSQGVNLALPQVASTSIVTRKQRTFLDLTPEEFDRMNTMSKMFAASTFNRGGKGDNVLTAGDYFLIMLKGLELGISPMAAIDMIDVIGGKPVLSAKGMLALIKSSGELDDIRFEGDDTYCTVTVVRRGQSPHVETFTIEDARRFMTREYGKTISLAEKANWRSMPGTMLKWRATANAVRTVFPDRIGGMYTHEELDDGTVIVQPDGSMQVAPTVPMLPQQTQTSTTPPKPTQKKAETDKQDGQPEGNTAGETWLNTDLGKQQLRDKLTEIGATTTEDYAVYLKGMGLDPQTQKFGDAPYTSFAAFARKIDAIFAANNAPAKPRNSNASVKPTIDKDKEYVCAIDIFDFATVQVQGKDKDAMVFGAFHPELPAGIRIYQYSRNDFLKKLQKSVPNITQWIVTDDDGNECDVTKLTAHTQYMMDMIEITFTLSEAFTQDGKHIGKIKSIRPYSSPQKEAPAEELEFTDEELDKIFGPDEE